jgi:serine/threonine protein kinase
MLARPETSRTATEEELVVLKAAADPEKTAQLMNEAYFLLMLDSPAIPRAYGIYDIKIQGNAGFGMVLDYKEGSDLSTWIPVGGVPEWAMKGIVAQLRDVLFYLNERCIVHRDIKPSNVLCERGEDGSVKVTLADFGIAAHGNEWAKLAERCGSPGYVAPEVYEGSWPEIFKAASSSQLADPLGITGRVLKTDIFSFGLLIYEMALGNNPFAGETAQHTHRNNARGRIKADVTSRLSWGLQDLLASLTERDPRKRCSISEAADHAWFQADLRKLGFTGADEDLRGSDSVSWEVFEQEVGRRED